MKHSEGEATGGAAPTGKRAVVKYAELEITLQPGIARPQMLIIYIVPRNDLCAIALETTEDAIHRRRRWVGSERVGTVAVPSPFSSAPRSSAVTPPVPT